MISEEIIKKLVNEYNRYRSPEATAKILRIGKDELLLEFSGSFCWTCGVDDWIIDFQYILQDNGIETEFEILERDYENERFLTRFKIRGFR